jgi:starvation-inducible outer membrane lipoprotein
MHSWEAKTMYRLNVAIVAFLAFLMTACAVTPSGLYTPNPATSSEISTNTDQGKVFGNVRAAMRNMGLIIKEQDQDGGYISAVKGDLSPFTLQVHLKQQGKEIGVEAKCIANYEYTKSPSYTSPENELPENVVSNFFQALKAIR